VDHLRARRQADGLFRRQGCALASRAYERDFADTAALLERYAPEELARFPCSPYESIAGQPDALTASNTLSATAS